MGRRRAMIRFGVHSGQQYSSFDTCVELWERVEALGYDWVSHFDHYRPPLGGPAGPCLDGPSLVAALAARTARIRCALMVSAITWRHPAIAASIAATIDHISGGRVEFGLGAGGPDLGYGQYGIPFPAAGTRVEMLDEACQVLRGLWTRESFTFHGRHFRLTDAHLSPKPVQSRLPLVIGGDGDRLLRIAARHADVWNTLAAGYRGKLATLRLHCADLGRDPAEIRQSLTFRAVLAATPRAAVERAPLDRLPAEIRAEYLTVGTPEQCVEDLRRYAELGVRDFILGARPPVDWTTVELFAKEVIPALREAM